MAASASTVPASAPLGETSSGEYQRDECDLQRTHKILLIQPCPIMRRVTIPIGY
jgi:hypothetical protein